MSHDVSYLKVIFPDRPVVCRTLRQVPANGIACVIHGGKVRLVDVQDTEVHVLASTNSLSELHKLVSKNWR